ncbi:ABC transporter permease [Oscillibacter sp.]|uniref:ABC transporter permease n=1 Tax=Oscillibacter sp. TaxID=1945593 RepID=UPI002D7E7C56|nr:ABC transporter permease [Oscillibacter sp.]
MIRVANKGCIRRLGFRSMRAAQTRNIVAVLAIALTTVLFTSLFTIASSINYSFQQENFRQAGGDCHGSIKDITWEQVEELRADPLVKEGSARMFLGMPSEVPFNKSHVEVSYMEPAGAPHQFCEPTVGTLPREGTDEAATDTHVLALLGVKPEIGAKFTLTFNIDDQTTNPIPVTRTFTLSGWWEYDSAVVANHVLVPRSAAEEIAALGSGDPYSITGKWTLNVMLDNAMSIEEDINQVLENHGYQGEDPQGDNYLRTGVNWGYSGAQLSNSFDITTLLAIVVLLLLIIFTGYLIIYNVFQISVTNDIRFYGLLKTIGTTGKQLKRIVRQQALLLSLIGIPFGLLLGFVIGNQLTPVIMAQLSYKHAFVSFNPLIFIGAALFSLLTVFLSCARPGRMAAKVSPVEAVRYTEGGTPKKPGKREKTRKVQGGASLPKMAWANLGRSRGKTVVTVISLTLAVVLATMTYTFSIGFDMMKYLQNKADVDFILGDAAYFRSNFYSTDEEVPEAVISDVRSQSGIEENGRIYGNVSDIEEFVTEEWYRGVWSKWNPPEILDQMIAFKERTDDGLLADRVQLYGMEDFPLSLLDVLEGDLAPLSDPSQKAIAAVYLTDDYDATIFGSNWAKLGDKVTLRYVTEREYFYMDNGEIIEDTDNTDPNRSWTSRAVAYEDVEYTVCALVQVPLSINYRYYGADQFVMGAERFRQDTGTDSVMTYIFNTTDEAEADMESFLAEYTESVQPLYDYESRATYVAEFEGFRSMFMTMGGALSLIIGLVGVLNFVNAVLTGILTRKRELAVLQSVGMTGKQLKTMLVYEGLYYTLLALAVSLVMTLALGPLLGSVLGDIFWFFSYRLTVAPILVILPIFLALGALVPLWTYRSVSKRTIVERLREAEA